MGSGEGVGGCFREGPGSRFKTDVVSPIHMVMCKKRSWTPQSVVSFFDCQKGAEPHTNSRLEFNQRLPSAHLAPSPQKTGACKQQQHRQEAEGENGVNPMLGAVIPLVHLTEAKSKCPKLGKCPMTPPMHTGGPSNGEPRPVPEGQMENKQF